VLPSTAHHVTKKFFFKPIKHRIKNIKNITVF